MKRTRYHFVFGTWAALSFTTAFAQPHIASFDSLLKAPNRVINGSGAAVTGSFNSGSVEFPNTYQTGSFAFWSDGWAYSNIQNDTSAGFQNLYAAYTKTGYGSAGKYAVGQSGSVLRIKGTDAGKPVKGLYVTNATYPALSMRDGDQFAKKFGGANGQDPDYFVLSIKAYAAGALSTDSVLVYLADFRSPNANEDSIVKSWIWANTAVLGNADSLKFQLFSSDVGSFGMNTPGFFCIDQVITDSDTADFENLTLSANSAWFKKDQRINSILTDGPFSFKNSFNVSRWGDFWSSGFAFSSYTDTVTAGSSNLYSAYAGSGYNSNAYTMVQSGATMYIDQTDLGEDWAIKGFYITNSTYAALSMKNGDQFGKKFGGANGTDPDWMKIACIGYSNGTADTIITYLADFRSPDNSADYIQKEWKWVDLSGWDKVDSIRLVMTSSDTGQFGMNTPSFFAMDQITLEKFTGLATKAPSIRMSLFPNPATEKLFVESEGDGRISIMDITGKEMGHTILVNGSANIDVNNLTAGMYWMVLETTTGRVASKWYKE